MEFDDLSLIFDKKRQKCVSGFRSVRSYGSNPNNLAIYEAIFSLIIFEKILKSSF